VVNTPPPPRTPPPPPKLPPAQPPPPAKRINVGDICYVRVKVLHEETGQEFLPPDYFQCQPIDRSRNPIKDGCYTYLFGDQLVTLGEMSAIIKGKS
jgi:hypothetical protein